MRGVPRLRRAIFSRSGVIDVHFEQRRRAAHDARQLLSVVMIEAQHQAEAPSQRSAHQTLARGRADGCESRDGHGVRARARAGADQNVHAKIFERRIEDFLHVGQQTMNLVDEEHLAARGCL